MYSGQKGNLNMQGAYWHILQTLVGSFIVIVSGVVIYFTGFLLIDPQFGMAFGLVLFWPHGAFCASRCIFSYKAPPRISIYKPQSARSGTSMA
jgi:Co/Zn/Cd efflux system component